MRRFDKDKHIANANLLAEQRYLEAKALLAEDFPSKEKFVTIANSLDKYDKVKSKETEPKEPKKPTPTDEGDVMEANGEPFPLYHETYGSAINAVDDYAKKRGVELDQEEYRMAYQDAFFTPEVGETKSDSITIYKGGKQLRKTMNVQIYGMNSGKFELNMYIN